MAPKRKHEHQTLEEFVNEPACYFCERDFRDENALHEHLKSKHLFCHICYKHFSTPGSVRTHSEQVHKEPWDKIPNALPGHDDPSVEIFGMFGVPPQWLENRKKERTNKYLRDEAEYRAKYGNPMPGSEAHRALVEAQAHAPKNPKLDVEAERARIKAEKARRKALKEQGLPINGTANVAQQDPASVSFSVSRASVGHLLTLSPFQGPGNGMPNNSPPAQAPDPMAGVSPFAMYGGGAPVSVAPLGNPAPGFGSQSGSPVPAGFAPSGWSPPTAAPPPAPYGQAWPQPPYMAAATPPPNMYSPQVYPQPPYNVNPTHAIPVSTPVSQVSHPPQQTALPQPPGLPQRPTFGIPAPSKEDMRQMHVRPQVSTKPKPMTGYPVQSPAPSQPSMQSPYQRPEYPQNPTEDEIDGLIASVTGQSAAQTIQPAATHGDPMSGIVHQGDQHFPIAAAASDHGSTGLNSGQVPMDGHQGMPRERTDKPHESGTVPHTSKSKAKLPTKLAYSDSLVSVEEKLATMPHPNWDRARSMVQASRHLGRIS